jgi:hypothetical protein
VQEQALVLVLESEPARMWALVQAHMRALEPEQVRVLF